MACICDFCSAPDPQWRYPARNFIGYEAGGIIGESIGEWAACQECHQLIVLDERARLTERSVVSFIAFQPELVAIRSELETELGTLHGRFFENRTGQASAIV